MNWLEMRIRCPCGGATCLSAECRFSELAKCGVIWRSEFRGKYLNVNVLLEMTDELMLSDGKI